ncbi:MAG: PH domain-containing protein [Nitriliruptoraceae bacterium]
MRVPSRLLRDREMVLLQQRAHGHLVVIPVIWAMLAAAAAGAALAALGTQRLGWILGAAGLGWFILAGPRLLRWWTTRYVVTTGRLIVRRGWFAGIAAEVDWLDVSDVWIDQTLLQRWGGWATVHVDLFDGHDDVDGETVDRDVHHGTKRGNDTWSERRAGRSRPDNIGDGDDVDEVPDSALALTDVGSPEAFRSRCVVAMEVADAISEGADTSGCYDILDDLADRGHVDSAELAWLRRVVASLAAN